MAKRSERSTPDPNEHDGGRPDAPAEVPADEAPDVLFPDTLAPRAYQDALRRTEEEDDSEGGPPEER